MSLRPEEPRHGDPDDPAAHRPDVMFLARVLERGVVRISQRKVEILWALMERDMTCTQLSRGLLIDRSSAFRHLRGLVEAGLAERLETGRKWVYHRITDDGRALVRGLAGGGNPGDPP